MRRVVRRWLLHLREDGVSWGFFVFQLYIGLLEDIFILRVSYVYPTCILRVSYVYPTCLIGKKFTKLGIFGDRMLTE